LAFMVCSCEDMTMRLFETGAVVLGFMSHLVLDEIWSVQVQQGRVRLKKSSGTALKFWGRNLWGNISVYAKLLILIFLAVGDPVVMEKYGVYPGVLERFARRPASRAAASAQEPPPLPSEETDGPLPPQSFPLAPVDRLVPSPVLR